VFHEFDGRIPHGGSNRASGSVGFRWVISIVLFFVVLAVLNNTPQHTTTTHAAQHKNTNTLHSFAQSISICATW
jgi:hypothetical protein